MYIHTRVFILLQIIIIVISYAIYILLQDSIFFHRSKMKDVVLLLDLLNTCMKVGLHQLKLNNRKKHLLISKTKDTRINRSSDFSIVVQAIPQGSHSIISLRPNKKITKPTININLCFTSLSLIIKFPVYSINSLSSINSSEAKDNAY